MQPNYILKGRRIELAPLDLADIPLFARWVNAGYLQPYLNRPWTISESDERRRMEKLINAPDAVGFSVRLRSGGELIGRTAIWNIHAVNKSGLFTVFIGEPEYWSQGLGTEATALTMIYGMDELALHRLELECFAYNERGLRCYEKLGFKREGARREARFHEGAYHDAIQMAILNHEWTNGLRRRVLEHLDPEAGKR